MWFALKTFWFLETEYYVYYILQYWKSKAICIFWQKNQLKINCEFFRQVTSNSIICFNRTWIKTKTCILWNLKFGAFYQGSLKANFQFPPEYNIFYSPVIRSLPKRSTSLIDIKNVVKPNYRIYNSISHCSFFLGDLS